MQARKDFVARVALRRGFAGAPAWAPTEGTVVFLSPNSNVQCDYCCREDTKIHADHGYVCFDGRIAVAYLGCVDELTAGARALHALLVEKGFLARRMAKAGGLPLELGDIVVEALIHAELDIRDCAPGAVIDP